jgi:hypothetical protein
VLVALDVAAHGNWGNDHLSARQREAMSCALETHEHELLQLVESESKTPSARYAPLWEPYGHSERMLYDSALTTIDFLTLYRRPPWSSVCAALRRLAEQRVQKGLPYDPSSREPDVGVSVYFAMICYRPRVAEQLLARGATAVLDAARDCGVLAGWLASHRVRPQNVLRYRRKRALATVG